MTLVNIDPLYYFSSQQTVESECSRGDFDDHQDYLARAGETEWGHTWLPCVLCTPEPDVAAPADPEGRCCC